jgi:hypothetical protein
MPTQAQRGEYYAEGFFVTDDVVEPAMLTKLTDAARRWARSCFLRIHTTKIRFLAGTAISVRTSASAYSRRATRIFQTRVCARRCHWRCTPIMTAGANYS